MTAFAALQKLGRYWSNSGHHWIFAREGSGANDPKLNFNVLGLVCWLGSAEYS